LLQVHGIGPETADDILLYACHKPVFVVDTYTRRILSRHGLVGPAVDYETLRAVFEWNLKPDAEMYKDYHGLLVLTGNKYCRPTPRCEECPLRPLLVDGRPCGG
jgi:endonuclease-3 related protein